MKTEEMKIVQSLLLDALNLAREAKDCSIDDPDEGMHEDRTLALAYAAACTAKYSAAQAIYTLCPDPEICLSELFKLFKHFLDETFSDYGKSHSNQQVINAYYDLESVYKKTFDK